MTKARILFGLVLFTGLSLGGDYFCRSVAFTGDRDALLETSGDEVERLPDVIGLWRAAGDEPLSPRVTKMLRCSGQVSRAYVDETTGDRVSLVLLAGEAGPLVAHTPEVCYPSSAWEMLGEKESVPVRGAAESADQFDRVEFRSTSVGEEHLQVYYAWRRPGGRWQAPRSPRWQLGGAPMLFKIQVATLVRGAPEGEPAAEDQAQDSSPPESQPAQRFLNDLLPVLDQLLEAR